MNSCKYPFRPFSIFRRLIFIAALSTEADRERMHALHGARTPSHWITLLPKNALTGCSLRNEGGKKKHKHNELL